jgi:hypothetical protein
LKRRKGKKQLSNKFKCDLCSKSYSYKSALNTHKRNKHTPLKKQPSNNNITEKKTSRRSSKQELTNNASQYSKDNIEYLAQLYYNRLISYFGDKDCILYKVDSLITTTTAAHGGYRALNNLTESRVKAVLSDKNNCNIDDVLSMYILSVSRCDEHSGDNNNNIENDYVNLELVISYCIILREYLNLTGWDLYKKYNDYGVVIGRLKFNNEFTGVSNCHNIPDLINDFVSVFVKIDPAFDMDEVNLLRITDNLCNWLFVNGFTNLKVTLSDSNLY